MAEEQAEGQRTTELDAALDIPTPAGGDLKTQIVRFVITGAASGVLDLGLTLLFQHVLGFPEWAAKSIGFVCGTTMAYLINRRWTFKADPSMARFVAVALLYLVTFVVQVGIYTVLSRTWDDTVVWSMVAYVIAQGTATVINFVVQRMVIFKIR